MFFSLVFLTKADCFGFYVRAKRGKCPDACLGVGVFKSIAFLGCGLASCLSGAGSGDVAVVTAA